MNRAKVRQFLLDLFYPRRILTRSVLGETMRFLRMDDMSEAMVGKALLDEPYTLEWIVNMPRGSVFYDIGANVGVYSILAALTGKKVIAFEPFPANLYVLYRNLQLNNCFDSVAVIPLALDHTSYIHNISILPIRDEFGAANLYDSHQCTGYICGLALDALQGLPNPDYVKIDVDGPENDVLCGGTKTLSFAKEIQIEFRFGCEASLSALGFIKCEILQGQGNHRDDRYRKGNDHERIR